MAVFRCRDRGVSLYCKDYFTSLKHFYRSSKKKINLSKYITRTTPKNISKSSLRKLPEQPPVNASFMTPENIRWFNFVLLNWTPALSKPLMFLPCGCANKTRNLFEGDSRKFISQSTTHQFLSEITRNSHYEQVILSEPLTIIPYSLEHHPLRPDYNLPPDFLSIQSEFIFTRQVALVLATLHMKQPLRQRIYYVGGRHHYFILHHANIMIGSPFQIIFRIPPRGICDFAPTAREFVNVIDQCEAGEIIPPMEEISLEKYLKSRGRYTHKAFWRQILVMQGDKTSTIKICSDRAALTGFSDLYAQITPALEVK